MPFKIDPEVDCASCPHGYCVVYIREQSKKMKDRDTLYRIKQIPGMSCAFDNQIPGFARDQSPTTPLVEFAERPILNATSAGKYIQDNDAAYFGKVEAPFLVTTGQVGKVRGDVFEMLCRAVLWNCAAVVRGGQFKPTSETFQIPEILSTLKKGKKLALLTLGDNYDLKKLLKQESALKLAAFEKGLEKRGTSIKYSTPDIVCVDTSAYGDEVNEYFDHLIESLNADNQERLNRARSKIEGKVDPSDIIFAGGIKTSIRSDRMYQFLYEANSWKFLWSRAFRTEPSAYYVLTSQVFGADPRKLSSVDFSSVETGLDQARKAIDGVFHLDTPAALIGWLVETLAEMETHDASAKR
jgi:hypothetical protein